MTQGSTTPFDRPGGSGNSGQPGGSGLRGAVRGFVPVFIIASLVVTPVAAILALMLSSAGEDGVHFGAAMALFPYSFLCRMLLPSLPTKPWFVLAFAQYPIYAVVFDILMWKRKLKWGLLAVAVLHLIVAAICLSGALQMPPQ